MLSYYVAEAIRGLKRNVGLTVLMIVVIGFGIGASTTTFSVFRAVSGDPIPSKSAHLFVPQIDPWGPTHAIRRAGEPPDALTYLDATRLMRDHRAHLQSAIYAITPLVTPSDGVHHPFDIAGHAVYGEFFPMLEVPFLFGSGWNSQSDEQHASVAVISAKLNKKLFGGANSVGKTLNVQGRDFSIVGVVGDWNPQPRYFDIMDTGTGGFTGQDDDVFIPFTAAIDTSIENVGFTMCAERPPSQTLAGTISSSCVWIAYVAQLDNAEQAAAYKNYLLDYARDQQQSGRFGWAPNVRLRTIMGWLDYHHVVPSDTRLSFLVALGLLLVCLANSAGVMLGKFLRRERDIGLRRMLGAPRAAIYLPCFIEAAFVGLAGGVVGVILAYGGLQLSDWVLPKNIASLAHLDLPLLFLAMAAAILGTILAALYPGLRVARTRLAGRSTAARFSSKFNLSLPPTLATLHRHKMSVMLTILQVTLSLAIVANALFVIGQRLDQVRQPTGIDEQNLLAVSQQWIGASTADSPASQAKLDSLLQQDLQTLKGLPDVVGVTSMSALPLTGTSSNVYLNLSPMQPHGEAFAGSYIGDEQTLKTLGIHLTEGRDFIPADVTSNTSNQPVVIVTSALASKLFPVGSALGKSVYLDGGSAPSTIVGVVDRLHVPSIYGQEASSPWYSVITPARMPSNSTLYVVRVRPSRLASARQAVRGALYSVNPARIMDDDSVHDFSEIRADAYRADIGTAMLMGVICILLLGVLGAGVAGLSNAWVSERQQQIGIRRALGARKRNIFQQFQLENVAIVGCGAVIGVGGAYGLNKLLMSYFEVGSLPILYALVGAFMVMLIGQCAVFVPARRASHIPPAVAVRSL
ncbi:MAG: ABC transporter permease [Rhodanobacter sp.]